ncbi:MAG: DUF697 domain-containing protein [Clostridia bacterium]|nr:DUF697 domain-containing protein [Clostridia bacterium]
MKKMKEQGVIPSETKAQKYALKAQEKADKPQTVGGEEFSASMSDALKQKNEKSFFFGILAVVAVIVLLLIGALADILTLAFEVNRIFGYAMSAITAILLILFVLRPVCKVLGARFFITDITSEGLNVTKRKNRRALKEVSTALVKYNNDPKNVRFRYLSDENTEAIEAALKSGNSEELRAALKKAYATDVGSCANSMIFKSAGKVFLRTSVSQNDKIDAVSVLLTNLSLIKQIVGIYGYRPSYARLFKIYVSVLRNALIAYGMENVNWFNVFGKFFSGVAKKVPFVDTLVDSAVQGTVNAFLTILVGYKTKRYLCSDYKKQEKIETTEERGDEEVRIASALAKEIRKKNKDKADALAE